MPASSTVLQIRSLTKILESGGSRFELRIPDLSFQRGRFYGIVGRSGSGKSSLLDLLAMVSRPTMVDTYELIADRETVDLANIVQSGDDAEISRIRLRHFGYILQSGGLFSFLTVRENLQLPFILAGIEVNEDTIRQFVELYDMVAQLDKKPSQLSGGQRQRVSILRALSLSPQIVLADEPTASVDENMAEVIVGELKRLSQLNGVTVIMVSHDLDLVRSFADEIITLRPEMIGANSTLSVIGQGGAG
ncbi:ABC transporter ATP-binding protein [Ancylobacter sp. TS-1]|uniref:ABC transporter ATP-binding protein n=1 Tax=Ancylobacter sp. TS-1 TaxID=1850374 RepID=UPI001265CB6E|nr:ATP-binding cassette domain-containing protein [Ancylobacter sp. TS-1]QFR33585.1 ATP-binding cassette domain-containing protein [Ancylobacter sp. TS-1]